MKQYLTKAIFPKIKFEKHFANLLMLHELGLILSSNKYRKLMQLHQIAEELQNV